MFLRANVPLKITLKEYVQIDRWTVYYFDIIRESYGFLRATDQLVTC